MSKRRNKDANVTIQDLDNYSSQEKFLEAAAQIFLNIGERCILDDTGRDCGAITLKQDREEEYRLIQAAAKAASDPLNKNQFLNATQAVTQIAPEHKQDVSAATALYMKATHE